MKRILLVADFRGWIFERHCLEMSKRLSSKYHFDIVYSSESANKIPTVAQNYDLVYVLDPMPILYPPANKTIIGLRCEWLYSQQRGGPEILYREMYKNKCSIMHVVNHNQLKTFKDIAEMPLLLVQHGVDVKTFKPEKKDHDSKFTIACAGSSSINKGFSDVRECCEEIGVNFVYSLREKNYRSLSYMPEFYQRADVYVCFSETEGLNNSILEAGAMGLAVISTRCGESELILGDGRGTLIDRDKKSLAEAINALKNNELRYEMGKMLRKEIVENWSWDVKILEYEKMFDLFFNGV